jgi:hypothetical protein
MVAECGTGKTLMSIASCFVHAAGKRFTAIAMCPPHLPKKWAREVFLTLPNVRVFIVYDMRNNADPKLPHGMVEVAYEKGKIVHKGLKISLSELRKLGRKGFKKICPESSFFIMSKEKGKLGYFWKHAFEVAESGPNNGSVISIESGLPVETSSGGNLTRSSFDTNKYDETLNRPNKGTTVFSPLWQADKNKLQRMAPLDYMGRYMKDFFDYAIADELHQLAGDTAQGNGLAVLGRIGKKLVGLTGTMMGGYADDLYNILYRMDAPQMAQDGYAWGGEGRSVFQGNYGVCEEIVKRFTSENACSKASKASVTIKRKPGCSPLLFGKYLMENTNTINRVTIKTRQQWSESRVDLGKFLQVGDFVDDAFADWALGVLRPAHWTSTSSRSASPTIISTAARPSRPSSVPLVIRGSSWATAGARKSENCALYSRIDSCNEGQGLRCN